MKTALPIRSLLVGFFFISTMSMLMSQDNREPTTWSIVASYTINGKASGLAWDGTYIYYGIYGTDGDKIYKFNPANGVSTLQCSGTWGDSFGLTYKAPNLVNTDHVTSSSVPAVANEFNMTGAIVSTLNLPDHYMSGIAYDGGNYWVCTYYPDPGVVYKIDGSGNILSQFTPPADQPWDICTHGSNLWIADYNADNLYKVSTSGTILETHACENDKPAGVVFDGTYLWYCDGPLGGNSTLYKVDLAGTGTPAINVPVTSHDYGNVTVGTTSTWNCQVQNTGTANLTITSIGIPTGQPITTTFSTPQTVTPGNSVNVPLTYAPTTPGALNTQVSINSNDPISPTVNVSLSGNGVYGGPHISLPSTSHDWGERRSGAYSRWYLNLTNDGDATLTISELEMSDPAFIIDESIVLPVTVPSTGLLKIGIWFHPETGSDYSGILSIHSDAVGQSPLNVELEGTGVEQDYPMGEILWSALISGSYDNSPKAIGPLEDITGDGVDEVIVCSEDDFVRVFNGNASVTGDVMWATEIPGGSVYGQKSLTTIQDINGDGYRDIIVGTAWGDRSIIALSGKTGLQLWKHDTHEYGGGGWVYQVDAPYDYNDDGFPDVLAATGNDGSNTGPVRVYCLNGLTGISIWENNTGGPVFGVIGVEDFTGDGKPDVLAGASNQQENQSKMYGINGDNGDTEWTSYPSGTSVWGLMQIDDINGDGIRDMAAGTFNGQMLLVNAVNGANLHYLNIGPYIINRLQDMGDLNKDGYRDILVAHMGAQGVAINGYNGEYLWAVPLEDKSSNVGNIGDITFDGINDAIIGTLFQSNYAYFLDGWDGATLTSVPANDPVDAINAIPDIVGDSTMEMVVGDREGRVVCLSGGYDTSTVAVPGPLYPAFERVQIYPNPVSGVMYVQLVLDKTAVITTSLHDQTGRLIAQLGTRSFPEGIHTISWNRKAAGSNIPAGLYLIQVTIGENQTWKKAILE